MSVYELTSVHSFACMVIFCEPEQLAVFSVGTKKRSEK